MRCVEFQSQFGRRPSQGSIRIHAGVAGPDDDRPASPAAACLAWPRAPRQMGWRTLRAACRRSAAPSWPALGAGLAARPAAAAAASPAPQACQQTKRARACHPPPPRPPPGRGGPAPSEAGASATAHLPAHPPTAGRAWAGVLAPPAGCAPPALTLCIASNFPRATKGGRCDAPACSWLALVGSGCRQPSREHSRSACALQHM